MHDLIKLIDVGIDRAIHEGCISQEECDAWQTIKSTVLSQQTANSDYAMASRLYKKFLEDSLPFHHEDKFIAWCEQRLHPPKAADDA